VPVRTFFTPEGRRGFKLGVHGLCLFVGPCPMKSSCISSPNFTSR
jgi:hypothetical protein